MKHFSLSLITLAVLSSIFIACNSSCGNVSNIAKFEKQMTIQPTITYIDGAVKQLDMLVLDKFYIIQSDVEANQNQLSVYDKKTAKHLYSFAIKGHGRNETVAMDMFQNPQGDTLEIIDQAKYKVFKYKIGYNKAELLSSNTLKIPTVGPLQEIYRINDSTIIFNTLEQNFETYNDKAEKAICVYSMIDSLGLSFKDKDIADFHFAYMDNELCIGYRHINSIVKGAVDNMGKISIHDIDKVKEKIDLEDTRTYYWYVSMNENNIVAQYMGYEPGFISKASSYKFFSPKFEIEIYTTKLMPYAHIVPKSDFLRCKLTSKDHCIYSWNPLEDKENILKFIF